MVILLVCLALLCGGLAATMGADGVGVAALGCLLAILARIEQSGRQHKALMAKLDSPPRPPQA